jgi:hypothetical protein
VVLAIAAAGFVVDRVFFTPASAEAAAAPKVVLAPVAAELPAAAPIATTAPAIPAGWLAERLRTATAGSDNDNTPRDVFAAPASWRPAPKVVAAVATPKPQLFAEQFRHDHHLTAVVIDGRHGRAVVDGQLVAVGDSIDQFRLTTLTRQSARFVHGDETVSLALTDSASPSVR